MHKGDLINPDKGRTDTDNSVISRKEALAIARKDAETVYRDLSGFRIVIEQRVDGWHVDYELGNVYLNDGGSHYVIDAMSGTIVSKRYDQ